MDKKTKDIRWKITLSSKPGKVFDYIVTDQGREAFWAEKSTGTGDGFILEFASGEAVDCKVLKITAPKVLIFEYFNQSRVEFTLKSGLEGGTEFEVFEPECPARIWAENHAGWVAWLFCLKAAADFGASLRNKSAMNTWDEGFVDG